MMFLGVSEDREPIGLSGIAGGTVTGVVTGTLQAQIIRAIRARGAMSFDIDRCVVIGGVDRYSKT
jgi:NhaP-type Na+/H+ or K+/H+ antiporter